MYFIYPYLANMDKFTSRKRNDDGDDQIRHDLHTAQHMPVAKQ